MPIYEYVCTENNHFFEEIQKISDPPLEKCKICQGPVTKVVSKSSFHLKGTGWYLTDYKNKNSAPSNPTPAANTTKASEPSTTEKKETAAPAAPAKSETKTT